MPLTWLSRVNRRDTIDSIYASLAWCFRQAHRLLSATQTGYLRYYVMGISAGLTVVLAIILYL